MAVSHPPHLTSKISNGGYRTNIDAGSYRIGIDGTPIMSLTCPNATNRR
ncbi:hypothetical protein ABGB07_43590 [Micromonosporaceae bacterium B7E4]